MSESDRYKVVYHSMLKVINDELIPVLCLSFAYWYIGIQIYDFFFLTHHLNHSEVFSLFLFFGVLTVVNRFVEIPQNTFDIFDKKVNAKISFDRMNKNYFGTEKDTHTHTL